MTGGAIPGVFLVPEGRILLLDLRAVCKHNSGEVTSSGSRVNRPGVSLLHKVRQIPAVVDMRMRKDQGIYLSRVKKIEVLVYSNALRSLPLIESALEQNSFPVYLEKMHRTRDCSGSTYEAKLHFIEYISHELVKQAKMVHGRKVLRLIISPFYGNLEKQILV